MSYILEAKKEFARLEEQSQLEAYDHRVEFKNLVASDGAEILDAGCGSGLLSRYFAGKFPRAEVTGCDFSTQRVEQAKAASGSFANLHFETQDLRKLSYPDASFDRVVSRMVVEHQSQEDLPRVVSEMTRVLKPGGELWVMDLDGLMLNLYPQTQKLAHYLGILQASQMPDLFVGRKIPSLLAQAGLTSIEWEIQTHSFVGELLKKERRIIEQRFENSAPYLEKLFWSKATVEDFVSEYMAAIDRPNAVLFFNKFIVKGIKPSVAPILPIGRKAEVTRK